ncbi:MAG TPA: DUF929 family protein [Acidimicrobiia bacterium]|jgi:hypothetical protein
MSPSNKRTQSAARKAPAARRQQGKPQASARQAQTAPARAGASNRVWWIGGAVAVVIAVAIIIAVVGSGSSSKKSSNTTDTLVPKYGRSPAPVSLVNSVTSVPTSVINKVGLGSGKLPQKISDVSLGTATKPDVLFVGAEFCPFCAAERWALVNSLSRFGTFSGLQVTHSSATDSYANTETFSFHGSTFASPYLTFSPVETTTNQPSNGSYEPLDTPSNQQGQLWQKYTGGGVPFIYFNGKFVATATYDPGVLANKTHAEIAAALHDPSSAVAKGAVGTANAMTAAICTLTNNKPATACNVPAITALQAQLRG